MSEEVITACKCCGKDFTRPDVRTWARYMAGRGFKVSSVYRCIDHNRAVGSRDTSQHVRGVAVDLHYPVHDNNLVAFFAAIVEARPDVVLRYPWGLHLDWRSGSVVGPV